MSSNSFKNNVIYKLFTLKSYIYIYTLQWTPSHRRAKAGEPTRTYIQQLSADTGYNLEDLHGVMDDRDRWQERVR